MAETVDAGLRERLAEAAEWLLASGYGTDWTTTTAPPADLWEAVVDAVHADPDGKWHGGELSHEDVDAWLRMETTGPAKEA